ncbi:MAG: 30S ribosomal protein S6 [bacterium]|nr:30S ribosomal protein S6 [bacterium]
MKQSQYEITYLLDPKLSEEDRGTLDTSIDELVAKHGGSVAPSAPTLRKKLAYDIKRNNSAFLRVVNIELDPAKIAAIKDVMKREVKMLRFTILATTQRKRITQEIFDKYGKKSDKDRSGKSDHRKPITPAAPQKEATMQEVEKGIEEALTQEVL